MKNLIVLIVSLFLLCGGISAIITGETSSMIGAGVAAPQRVVIFQEAPVRFLVEVFMHFGIGGAGLISLLKRESKK